MTVKYLGSYTYADTSTDLECRLRHPNIVIQSNPSIQPNRLKLNILFETKIVFRKYPLIVLKLDLYNSTIEFTLSERIK